MPDKMAHTIGIHITQRTAKDKYRASNKPQVKAMRATNHRCEGARSVGNKTTPAAAIAALKPTAVDFMNNDQGAMQAPETKCSLGQAQTCP